MGSKATAALTGKRQISLPVPFDDWQLLSRAAATKRIPVTILLLQLLSPGLQKLRQNPPTRDDDEE